MPLSAAPACFSGRLGPGRGRKVWPSRILTADCLSTWRCRLIPKADVAAGYP